MKCTGALDAMDIPLVRPKPNARLRACELGLTVTRLIIPHADGSQKPWAQRLSP